MRSFVPVGLKRLAARQCDDCKGESVAGCDAHQEDGGKSKPAVDGENREEKVQDRDLHKCHSQRPENSYGDKLLGRVSIASAPSSEAGVVREGRGAGDDGREVGSTNFV